jgi:hypothetical protein
MGHTWVMTVYNYKLIMPQKALKPENRAEKLCEAITQAEQEGWELLRISDDVNNALYQAWMRKPKS